MRRGVSPVPKRLASTCMTFVQVQVRSHPLTRHAVSWSVISASTDAQVSHILFGGSVNPLDAASICIPRPHLQDPSHPEILHGILGADLVGFHTNDYTQYFLRCAQRILGLEHEMGSIMHLTLKRTCLVWFTLPASLTGYPIIMNPG